MFPFVADASLIACLEPGFIRFVLVGEPFASECSSAELIDKAAALTGEAPLLGRQQGLLHASRTRSRTESRRAILA